MPKPDKIVKKIVLYHPAGLSTYGYQLIGLDGQLLALSGHRYSFRFLKKAIIEAEAHALALQLGVECEEVE